MDLAIVSDTHIPERAAAIPEPFRELIAAADLVVHAGDFTSPAALESVRELTDDLVAVYGNMDPRNLGLPAVATVDAAQLTVVVTHGTGPPGNYEERVAGIVKEEGGDVGVAGHSHEVLDVAVEGVRLLNPGSATGAPPAERTTMMTASVTGTELDVTLHEL